MKITIPAFNLELGGGTRTLVRVAEGLAAYGHDVAFLIPERGGIQWKVTVPVISVPWIVPDAFPKSDIILTNFWSTVPPAWESGAGQVVRFSLGYEPLWVKDPRAKETYLLPIPTLAISQWLASRIEAVAGRRPQVIHLGIEQETFVPPPPDAPPRSGILYIWRDKTLGYGFKGTDDFVQALGPVMQRYPRLPLTIVTPVACRVHLPYPHRVVVAPTDAKLAELYQQAAVFVSTSWFEGFSMPPLEAMSCGAAVVATNCGGIGEYARHQVNCLLVPPRTPMALAQAILTVLGDPALRQRLGAAGVATARDWSWQRTWKEMHEALTAIHEASRGT